MIFDADSHLMELPDLLTCQAVAAVSDLIARLGASTTADFDTGRR